MEPKFTLNRPQISDDEINSRKDFDGLVRQFKEQSIEKARSDKNFLKNKKATYAAVIAGVTVICTVTYFTVFNKTSNTQTAANDKINTTQSTQNTTPQKASKPYVAPPAKKLDVPYTTYKVNNSKGADLAHHTKSKIKVPQNAFVNKKGEDIVGDVEIRYREFHDQADIIVSGIPMTYDSAGTQYHFESAGMFDIRGYKDGEQVYIKPGKDITVELASKQGADRFNQYLLDTIAKNWKCLKKDTPKQDAALSRENSTHKKPLDASSPELSSPVIASLQKQIDVIPKKVDSVAVVYTKKAEQLPKAKQPSKPQKATGRPQFEMDVDFKDFPELSVFKDAVFEVGDENKNYRKELHTITWNSATISEGPQKGKNYILTLKTRQQQEKLIVYPVLTGENYDNALKQYEKKFAEYNTLLAKREAEEKRLKEEMAAKQKAYIEEQKKLEADMLREQIRIRKQMEEKLASQYKTASIQQNVVRVFQVSNFGIYNSDCPSSLPQGPGVHGIFATSESDASFRPETIYLVEHGKNKVYTLPNTYFSYEPGTDYSICALSGGQMFLCGKEEFKAAVVQKKPRFIMKPLPAEVTDAAGLRKALEI